MAVEIDRIPYFFARYNEEDMKRFDEATSCFACGGEFVPDDKNLRKVFDQCNLQCRKEREFPIFFHNLSKYDGNFLIRALNTFDDGKVTVLPRNEETYISTTKEFVKYKEALPNGKTVEKKITFNFKDSFLFIPFYLSKAAESLSEEDYSLLIEYGEHWELLKGKQVFPYTTLKIVASMKRTGLIPKEEFGTRLYQAQVFEKEPQGTIERESISDSDYEHYKRVMKAFNCKTFGDYISLYCSVDVALLTILFERLINICMDGFGVDASKSYTSAGFFWEAMLRKTGVKLELFTDPEKYTFFESAIRGCISVVSNRFADANNKYLPSYDSFKPSSYIMEWDANSLYGSEMLEPLPVGDFRNVREEGLRNLERSLKKGQPLPPGKGALLCVDLDYPDHLHNPHNDYPLAPEKIIVNDVEKLCPNLGNKRNYSITYELLLFYLQHGLVLKKIHKAVSYRIEAFLKDYINFCAEKRWEAKTKGDKFGDTFWKLAGNGVYGKTFECVRNRCNTKIMNGSDEKRLRKLFSQANYKDSEVIPHSNMVMVRNATC